MTKCAINGCSNNKCNKQGNFHFYRFPKTKSVARQWINACSRTDKLNPETARVCSQHFKATDYTHSCIIKSELFGKSSVAVRSLNANAVPSLFLPKQGNGSDKNPMCDKVIMIKEEDVDVQIKEEEIEVEQETTFFSEMEGMYSQQEKRSLSPPFHKNIPESKRQWPGVKGSLTENGETMEWCKNNSGQQTSSTASPTFGHLVNNTRNTQQLTTQTKQVVMNVHDFFRSQNQLVSESDLEIKVAAATGISVRSVQRVKRQAKEGRLLSPPLVRTRQSPVLGSIDDFVEGCLRKEILSFYERGEIPTLDALLEIVKEPPVHFQGGRTSLHKIIKNIGFQYTRITGGRQILIEEKDIVTSRCNFLNVLDDNRNSSSPRSEVYIDETFVCQKEFEGTIGPKFKKKKMKYVIVHAGGEKGFVSGGLHVFKPQINNRGHYKDMVTPQCFQIWFKDQLLPNIPNNSLIIMDSAHWHSNIVNKVPNTNMKKNSIIQWLQENNIAHDKTVSKSELLHIVNSYKEKLYDIDLLAKNCGHEVVRLPPHHNHLNPMVLIWHQVKSEIKKKSQDGQALQTLEEIIKDIVTSITEKDWRICMHHSRKMGEEYKNKDKAVNCMLEKFLHQL
ncbi:uncharacterized protein LOC123505423 isoform X2 [Portunus trituberculatus]|uniref:uncharacterized protein LOC123505423 isoform X2 n=1 Tax=Portunus trituberculatus TaxID=210409 RepID=UPI001E1D1962|nr:uncharacterized protein LOC123505423 isoform X2 [Portunus trituberculatus]XP_045112604.1 uncharacterized protein LOC123505423 isoform X2 [Portunus trituberculatus]